MSFAAVEETIVVAPDWAAVPIVNVAAFVSVENDPVRVVFPTAFPRARAPVPPVLIVVTPAPAVFRLTVPCAVRAESVVAPETIRVVPTVAEVPTAREVVEAKEVPEVIVVVEAIEPGAMNAAGILNVIVAPAPAVVIWLAEPRKLKLFATGERAPPELAVTVFTADELCEERFQVADCPESDTKTYSRAVVLSIHCCPIGNPVSLAVGARGELIVAWARLLDRPCGRP